MKEFYSRRRRPSIAPSPTSIASACGPSITPYKSPSITLSLSLIIWRDKDSSTERLLSRNTFRARRAGARPVIDVEVVCEARPRRFHAPAVIQEGRRRCCAGADVDPTDVAGPFRSDARWDLREVMQCFV
ncbi:hypothetical protein EVAR_60920_1 [Eumeta japonica]|uniref:Uncharacterized protein n=1 Tax=Eumeta variegata TaxID=151549 RepID=A0A4C1ZGL7_EUMVA|nr:hypothetical protein EVAR_60920_1 [Eumeta japonica]